MADPLFNNTVNMAEAQDLHQPEFVQETLVSNNRSPQTPHAFAHDSTIINEQTEEMQRDISMTEAESQVPNLEIPTQVPTSETPTQALTSENPPQASTLETPTQASTSETPTQAPVSETTAQAAITPIPTPTTPAPDTISFATPAPSSTMPNRTATPSNANGTVEAAPTIPAKAAVHGAPTRAYLNTKVTGVLLEGMKLLAKDQPDDPLRVLGEYLLKRSKEIEGTI